MCKEKNNKRTKGKNILRFNRFPKYYYLRFLRLRGEPHELALGMAFGIFSGLLPIIPFHTAFAVMLAFIFKGSKITAALGVWVSNPLNWYILYYIDYRIGAFMLGLSENNKGFSALLESTRNLSEGILIMKEIIGASSTIIAAFVIGGIIIGVCVSLPSYFLFLKLFKVIRVWRERRKQRK